MKGHVEHSEVKENNKELRRNYPRKLSTKILLFCFILISILCAGIGWFSYYNYERDMRKRYEEYEAGILKIVAEHSDAEGIQEAIQTQVKNEAYKQMEQEFTDIKEKEIVKYIFALYFKEKDENIYYVTNGHTEGSEPSQIHELGDLPLKNDFKPERVKAISEFYEEGSDKVLYLDDIVDANKDKLMTAYYLLFDKEDDTVCVIGVDILFEDINKNFKTYAIRTAISVVVLGIVFLSMLYLLLSHQVVSPIKKLSHSAKHFIKQQENQKPGELVFEEVPIHSKDEIQLLSDSLNYMVEQLNEYMQNVSNYAAEQERINVQFGFVQQLKENLFPFQFPVFQDRSEFHIYAKIRFSKINSGDFYNFFLIDSNHICFFAGTASGSGVMSTMVAMIATIYMENYARLGYLPNRILSETNNRLSENNRGEITVNTFIGIVDLVTGEFTYAQVGEPAPLIKLSGEDANVLDCTAGFSLGSLENVAYAQRTMHLTQGESVFLYTAGVSGRRDKKGYEFSHEYVMQMWNTFMLQEYELNHIVDNMMEKLEQYAKGAEQENDETMLIFRYLG